MEHFLLSMIVTMDLRGQYQGLPSVHYPLSVGYTLKSIPIPLSFSHAVGSILWTVVHCPFFVIHSLRSILWSIFHGPLSVDHTLMSIPGPLYIGYIVSIPWTIVHGPLFWAILGGRYHGLLSMFHFPFAILTRGYHGLLSMFTFPLTILACQYHGL